MRKPPGGTDERGQALIEFALVIPIIFFLLMALLEVALAFNAFMGINRASQMGAHTAAIMTNQAGTDCLILQQVEDTVQAPNRHEGILAVVIQRTPLAGNRVLAEQLYKRDGSSTCTLPDGTDINVPYTLHVAGYPAEDRCSKLTGCDELGDDRATVDNIGVVVRYKHEWVTPLSTATDFLPGGNVGWSFGQRNIFRMEPSL